MNRLTLFIAVIILILVVGGAAFFLLRDEPAAPETDTTEEAVATEEEEAAATEAAPESTAEFVGEAGGYSLTPAQAELYTADREDIPASLGNPEAGQQWVLLTVSLLSEASDEPVAVAASELTLFDENDNEYSPLEDGGTLSPYLVGADLTPGESLRGVVAFQIPEDAVPAVIQWCPNGTCEPALRADILLPVTE